MQKTQPQTPLGHLWNSIPSETPARDGPEWQGERI
jgi:hypothetical protein